MLQGKRLDHLVLQVMEQQHRAPEDAMGACERRGLCHHIHEGNIKVQTNGEGTLEPVNLVGLGDAISPQVQFCSPKLQRSLQQKF